MTEQEKATNYDTMRHIERVHKLLNFFIVELLRRAEQHDQSKLVEPEVAAFTAHTASLANTTYGSKEYHDVKNGPLGKAIEHHYAHNRHHPEHFKDGINDMTLVDLVEMFCDWKASSERHHDGNIRKSIEVNANRFGISPQLVRILENTLEVIPATADTSLSS